MINQETIKVCMMIKDENMQSHCLEKAIQADKGDLGAAILFGLLAVLFFSFLFYIARLMLGK